MHVCDTESDTREQKTREGKRVYWQRGKGVNCLEELRREALEGEERSSSVSRDFLGFCWQ